METTTIPTADGPVEAWVARPDGPGGHPGALLCIDAIGLRPQIATMMERIASWGLVVLAPNLFHRTGTVAELLPTQDLRTREGRAAFFAGAGARFAPLTTDVMAADVEAYVRFLAGLEGVAPGPVGVTGYCAGARFATLAAGACPDLVGAVGGFHGGGLATEEPDSPHRRLAGARARFVYGHAADDASMPPEAVARLGAALEAAGVEFTNEVLPGPHGFTMADTAMYSAEADARHWALLEPLLRGLRA